MSGSKSRNKGQRGEREVIKLLQHVVDKVSKEKNINPIKLERNLMQSNNGGYDIVGIEWLALEVKFQEIDYQESWWKQTCKQATTKQVPVLFFRKSRQQWKVKMFGFLTTNDTFSNVQKLPVFISKDDFLYFFEEKFRESLIN